MTRGNRVFAVICLGISLWLIVESTNYNYVVKYTPGPGFFPFWVGVALALFSFALLVETFGERAAERQEEPRRLPERRVLARVGLILLITSGFSLLMMTLGFTVSAFLFVSALLFFLERVPAVGSLVTGFAMSASVYLIFEYWMEIGLPPGLFGF